MRLERELERLRQEVSIEGKTYLDLNPRGHCPLDVHLQGILQWRPSNPTRKMNYMDA